jgi:hypothetical protein
MVLQKRTRLPFGSPLPPERGGPQVALACFLRVEVRVAISNRTGGKPPRIAPGFRFDTRIILPLNGELLASPLSHYFYAVQLTVVALTHQGPRS